MDTVQSRHYATDAGFAAGLLLLALQATTLLMPVGEGRDWAQYYAVGAWAALMVAGAFAGRFRALPTRVCVPVKILLSAYAVIMLNLYAVSHMASVWLLWLWLLSGGVAMRLVPGAGMRAALAWLLLCVFSLCGTLAYNSPWLAIASDPSARQYTLAFAVMVLLACPFMYATLAGGRENAALRPAIRWALLCVALYVLAAFMLRTGGFGQRWAVYHWRAFTEPADSLRDGGWLLWDVPSLYGFMQTLAIAFFPATTTWQSLYLLNALLLSAAGGMVFAALFKRFPTLYGFAGCLLVALACSVLTLPATPDPRIMPNTGALRFFWIYPVVSYLLYLCLRVHRHGVFPARMMLYGHLLWLAGALWAVESAVFVTVIWIPACALLAYAQALASGGPLRATFFACAMKAYAGLAALAVTAAMAIGAYYLAFLGHAPDLTMLTAYTKAYAFGFSTLPITKLGCAPCWLLLFYAVVMAARVFMARAAVDAPNVMSLAVLYALVATFWAASGYYIPFSEDFHLTGTLPLVVFLMAALLLLLPVLGLPQVMAAACEKATLCFYSVLVMATLCHLNPGALPDSWESPADTDITRFLPAPPAELLQLVDAAGIPAHAHVQVLSSPMTLRDNITYLTGIEGYYFPGLQFHSWLLPNTLVGYEAPLPPEVYERIAKRRARRLGGSPGWLIETEGHGLALYPWLENALSAGYRADGVFREGKFILRRYQSTTAR